MSIFLVSRSVCSLTPCECQDIGAQLALWEMLPHKQLHVRENGAEEP